MRDGKEERPPSAQCLSIFPRLASASELDFDHVFKDEHTDKDKVHKTMTFKVLYPKGLVSPTARKRENELMRGVGKYIYVPMRLSHGGSLHLI